MFDASTRACDFPSLEGMIYLNSAAEGIPPLCVRNALLRRQSALNLSKDRHDAEEAKRVRQYRIELNDTGEDERDGDHES